MYMYIIRVYIYIYTYNTYIYIYIYVIIYSPGRLRALHPPGVLRDLIRILSLLYLSLLRNTLKL